MIPATNAPLRRVFCCGAGLAGSNGPDKRGFASVAGAIRVHSVFERNLLRTWMLGWLPVRVKKTRQGGNPRPGSDSTRTEKASVHHQHIEGDDRRQAQDHRPDTKRPENVFPGETLFLRERLISTIHDAPAFCCSAEPKRRSLRCSPAFRSYLTTGATAD
jgi:hypothetical protein